MYAVGRKTEPDTLAIHPPAGWQIADSLHESSYGHYVAQSGYDEFIDCPIQLGTFVKKNFSVRGVPFHVIFVKGSQPILCDMNKIKQMLQTVSAPAIDLFRGAPFKHYTYYIHLVVGSFAGGLEHRNCTVIALNDDPNLDFPAIAAHENFHAWNVKRIRPFELGPFDYNKPADTSQIWWSEGVTDYYSDILTYRSGLENQNWLLSSIRDRVIGLQHASGRHQVTLAQCGRDTWRADGFSSGGLNYYTKGYLVGWLLDCAIRSYTHGAKSLDDVMRMMYQKYHLPLPGFKKGDILKTINQVVGSQDAFDKIYRLMVHSTAELPYSIARSLGMQVTSEQFPELEMPFTLSNTNAISMLSQSAIQAGLKPGDVLQSITFQPWDGVGSEPSNNFTITVDRYSDSGATEIKVSVPPMLNSQVGDNVILDPTAGSTEKQLLQEWLAKKQ